MATIPYAFYDDDEVEQLLHHALLLCRRCAFNRKMLACLVNALEDAQRDEIDRIQHAFSVDRTRTIF